MKVQPLNNMKKTFRIGALILLGLGAAEMLRADPLLTSWFTTYSGRYARIYTNTTMELASNALTTWSNGTQTQSSPAYDGVQEVDYSSSWVYVYTTGLASYTMGPWQTGFPNLPSNQKAIFRIPRTPPTATNDSITGAGAVGIFVDGVEMFNSWDAFYWSGSADTSATSSSGGYWNRDAYINEGATFDPGNAHQQQGGTYHYHANPIALRYQLGDHVNWNSTSNIYSESTATPTKHSPLLAWVADGHPLYGPYGYSNATNSKSGVRRMISGYTPRNGSYGSDNISTTGAARTYLPAWALREYASAGGTRSGTTNGPAVSSSYPFGRYMQDNAYIGDLTNSMTSQPYQQGVDFDLDEFNGRWCVTPEFPNGVYAYFVAITSNGLPMYPYNIGNAYYGNPTGGTVTSIAETVTTNFVGGPNLSPVLNAPKVSGGTVTLTWSATEGGTYMVQSSSNLTSWTTNSTNVSAVLNSGAYTNSASGSKGFFRVARTALASYDPVSGSSSGGSSTITLSPNSGTSGNTYSITATLSSSANPPIPPHTGAPITTFTIGANNVTGASYVYNANGTGTVTGSVTLTTGTGSQTASITFGNPMGGTGPTYTQANAFTIH
jgi:hypothetical protein